VRREQVAVIIVNYRTAALTAAAVDSVLRSTGVDIHVVLVDNASGDDSVECLRRRFHDNPAVTLLVRDRNDGFAGGNNAGFEVARGREVRFALLLNSDTLIDEDCVCRLRAEADRDPATALACPRIVFGDRPDLLWFGGARFSMWRGRPIHVGLSQPVDRGWTEPRDLPFASGCALLVRLGAVPGPLFDESLFSYAEDLDLSLRLRRMGHRIRFVPDGRVLHFEGASHRRTGGQALRVYLNTRNVMRVAARHARWYHWSTLAPALLIDLLGRYAAIAVRDRDPGSFAAVWRGALDAVTGGRHAIERTR
jgi:GT2 family glycosyltransferase